MVCNILGMKDQDGDGQHGYQAVCQDNQGFFCLLVGPATVGPPQNFWYRITQATQLLTEWSHHAPVSPWHLHTVRNSYDAIWR
jgi:hypothetical protein